MKLCVWDAVVVELAVWVTLKVCNWLAVPVDVRLAVWDDVRLIVWDAVLVLDDVIDSVGVEDKDKDADKL